MYDNSDVAPPGAAIFDEAVDVQRVQLTDAQAMGLALVHIGKQCSGPMTIDQTDSGKYVHTYVYAGGRAFHVSKSGKVRELGCG